MLHPIIQLGFESINALCFAELLKACIVIWHCLHVAQVGIDFSACMVNIRVFFITYYGIVNGSIDVIAPATNDAHGEKEKKNEGKNNNGPESVEE